MAVLPWIWFEFLGFFGFLEDANLGFGLLLDFWDWIWISFGLDWIGNPKVELADEAGCLFKSTSKEFSAKNFRLLFLC